MSGKWAPAQEVFVVEHEDSTRQPKEGGSLVRAVVTQVTGLYVRVACIEGSVLAGETFTFWASSGWHAWDGWFRWRLMTYDELDAALVPEGSDFSCKDKSHRPHWAVLVRKANYSAFNGYHRTPGDYSSVICLHPGCGKAWRTKGAYVDELPNAPVEAS